MLFTILTFICDFIFECKVRTLCRFEWHCQRSVNSTTCLITNHTLVSECMHKHVFCLFLPRCVEFGDRKLVSLSSASGGKCLSSQLDCESNTCSRFMRIILRRRAINHDPMCDFQVFWCGNLKRPVQHWQGASVYSCVQWSNFKMKKYLFIFSNCYESRRFLLSNFKRCTVYVWGRNVIRWEKASLIHLWDWTGPEAKYTNCL